MNDALALLAVVAVLFAARSNKATTHNSPGFNFFRPSQSIAGLSYRNIEDLVNVTNDQNSNVDLDALFQKHGAASGIPWQLLKAVAMTESSLNPAALNHEGDTTDERASRGLMQILAPSPLNVRGWKNNRPSEGLEALFNPDVNLYYGRQILSWNLETYGAPRGIALYNRWAERHSPVNGPFNNQYYVDRVLGYFEQFGGNYQALIAQYGAGSRGV